MGLAFARPLVQGAGAMSESRPPRVHVQRDFLPPLALSRTLAALDRLSPSWRSSEALGLLGRSHTSQVRTSDLVARAPLDQIRLNLADATLQWARRCGFPFRAPPFLQMFPVRMLGDPERPPHQEPHVDSNDGQAGPPICTSVFYARVLAARGGELAVGRAGDLDDPVLMAPTANTMVSFPGECVHWVRPLYAGERLSVVVNFY
jgi:hypothetical protein